MKSFKNFEEFEFTENSGTSGNGRSTTSTSKAVVPTTMPDFDKVKKKRPWTRKEYEELAHPDVQRDINYETYLDMWNIRTDPSEYTNPSTYKSPVVKPVKEYVPYVKPEPTETYWNRLNAETRITIIIGIIGLVLSFLTLIALIIK